MTCDISIVVPVYNEEENIRLLHDKIKNVLDKIGSAYEVIYVDDCSTDNSYSVLREIKDNNTKIIKFRRNFGQTSAMQAGINNSQGAKIITLDADLQNDPEDIPKLIEKYNQGYDLVSGWRKNRQDNCIRTIPSKIANFLISSITKTGLHDTGCTLKVYNGEVLRQINLFADHHRFIPAIFAEYSNKIAEVEVNHHARIYGKSKYNIFRFLRVIIDLVSLAYWKKYKNRPMYFWGALSVCMLLLTILFGIFTAVNIYTHYFECLKILLPLLFVVSFILSVFTASVGIVLESILRSVLKQCNDYTYVIESII